MQTVLSYEPLCEQIKSNFLAVILATTKDMTLDHMILAHDWLATLYEAL